MARTAVQIQSDLDTINAALQDLYAGERLTTLIVGSGEFQRRYTYQELSVDNMLGVKRTLEGELAHLTPSVAPSFRTFSSIPLVIGKSGIR